MTQPTVDELVEAAGSDIFEVDPTTDEKRLLAASARAQLATAISMQRAAAALESVAATLAKQALTPIDEDPWEAAEQDLERKNNTTRRRTPTRRRKGGVAEATERITGT